MRLLRAAVTLTLVSAFYVLAACTSITTTTTTTTLHAHRVHTNHSRPNEVTREMLLPLSERIELKNAFQWQYFTVLTVLYGQDSLQEARVSAVFDVNSAKTVLYRADALCGGAMAPFCNDIGGGRYTTRVRLLLSNGIEVQDFVVEVAQADAMQTYLGVDGVIGLRCTNTPHESNFVSVLAASHVIARAEFSLYYGTTSALSQSFVTLGTADSALFKYAAVNATAAYANATRSNAHDRAVHLRAQSVYFSANNSTRVAPVYAKPTTFTLDSTSPFLALKSDTLARVAAILQNFTQMVCAVESTPKRVPYRTVLVCRQNRSSAFLPNAEFPSLKLEFGDAGSAVVLSIDWQSYVSQCYYIEYNATTVCETFFVLAHGAHDSIGYPILRGNYFVFDAVSGIVQFGPANSDLFIFEDINYFWYYMMIVIVFFWSILMVTCGVYYKEEMNRIMRLVVAIYRYLLRRDAASRAEILAMQMQDQM